MFTRAIVRPPAPNFSDGLTTAALGAPDFARALEQHDAYCAALTKCGLTVIRLKPDPRYPDSTFVEDTAVLVESLDEALRGFALITRPGAPSRLGEVMNMRGVLAKFYSSLSAIEAPGTLDGGDICQAASHFFIGVSERTNEDGAQQLANLLAPLGYTSSLVDIREIEGLLHLKSGLAYLGDNRLVVTNAVRNALPDVGATNFEIAEVNSNEQYAANCVRVNDYVLVADSHPSFAQTLRELGYQIIALEMSEFQKMNGGLSCLSLRF